MALLASAGVDSPPAAAQQKQVLVLHAVRRDAQIASLGDSKLPRMLDRGLPDTIDYHAEYLDLPRFPQPEYQAALRDFLRHKYEANRFDVILAMHEVALQFLAAYRDELFPGAPVIFTTTSPNTRRLPNSTGILAPVDLAGTLDLVAAMQPQVRRVVVVAGADRGDGEFERLARDQFERFERRFAFDYLTELPTGELERRLASLTPDTIVYYLLVSRDGGGESHHPLEYLDRIVKCASVPVYSWVDSTMGRGILGGSLKSQSKQLDAMGELALRVLRGEPADRIPTSLSDLHVTQVDWRQLRRWGISEARVPDGTMVMFKEPSAWDRYKTYIVAAVAVILAQSALMGALLVQRSRRRRAELQVRHGQGELRQSYDRIRDLAGRLLGAQDTERLRIARELHDDVSQQLALLSSDLELLSGLADAESSDLADDALRRVQTVSRTVHDLSHQLYPAKLQLIGLVPSLRSLQSEVTKRGLPVTFTHDGVAASLPGDLTLSLFRVAQEALQNAAKHSQARAVRMHLRGTGETLTLTISDDGVGFDPREAVGSSLGLVSMRERIEAVGGTLQIHSTPGAGTRLEVIVPGSAAVTRAAVAG